MNIRLARRTISTFQLGVMAIVIGAVLYMYNDWRTHTSHAAPLDSPSATDEKSPATTGKPAYPLDQGVSGTVQVNPDGSIKQL